MKTECTELFLKYREIARLVWNLGFLPNPALREWDSVDIYEEAMTRLFEGLILLALGYQGRVADKYRPGDVANFEARANHREVRLRVGKHPPGGPVQVWGEPAVLLSVESFTYHLKFVRFFDWDFIGAREFRFLEVMILRLDQHPDLVGRPALVEFASCSIWLDAPDAPESGNPLPFVG